MSRRRASTILAVLAALMMAPSSVSAAKPNELTAASVQPTSGSTATTFVLSVRYRSGAGNPASAVTATVAGQTLIMGINSGTSVDGIWTATTQLPVGSWTVTYSAEVAKGPTPTVGGGTVTVTANQPSPSGPVGSTPSSAASEPDVPVGTPLPNPAQSASPRPVAGAPSGAAQPSTPASNASPGAAPASSGGSSGSGGSEGRGGGGGNSSGGGAQPLASAAGAPAPSGRQGLPGRGTAGPDGPMHQGLLDAVLLFGIVGVAAVALVGVGWILVTGRRNEPDASPADAGTAADPGVRAIPTVEQRAIRRARLNQSNDPILAALGLPETDPPPARESEGRLPRSGKRVKG